MRITTANHGDVLCLYQSGNHIKILDTDESSFTCVHESGHSYVISGVNADAFIEKDPQRLSEFNQNYCLGRALIMAEIKALKILNREEMTTPSERADAERVLASVRNQQEVFHQRLTREHQEKVPGEAHASEFLSQLYERGSGSHDTLFGHRVENASQMAGLFLIDGRQYNYSDALIKLSSVTPVRQANGLDAQIANASNRRRTAAEGDITKTQSMPER